MNTTSIRRDPGNTLALGEGPSPLGSWLVNGFRRLASAHAAAAERRSLERDAAAVRALAARVRGTDPGFAADLDAAADRQESIAS